MSARHTLNVLGRSLQDMAPMIAAAVEALDQPGSRALRRKLDGEFHFLVQAFGVLQRECELTGRDVPAPSYTRATEVWPGRAAFQARIAREAKAAETVPAVPAKGRGLRLVVDNGHRVEAVEPAPFGGAA